jgi:hypothetical protein
MSIDVGKLAEDIKNVASGIVEKDITTLRGFSERQLKAIALQTALVGEGILRANENGPGKPRVGITEETRDFFVDNLKDMVRSFVRVLIDLFVVIIEKLWNAIVDVIWKAIQGITGVLLAGV